MPKLLPILLALIGLGAGTGAGLMLRPPESQDATVTGQESVPEQHAPVSAPEFVKLNNQFVVPVVNQAEIGALVILSIGLEVDPGMGDMAFSREPKIRDSFLQVLFNHANSGGFEGVFTDPDRMRTLRSALLESARAVMGEGVRAVLISDLVRQES